MNLARFIAIVLLGLGVVLTPARAEPPNILLLLGDDHRADAVGAHGNPYVHTPAIDRLADRGFSFRNAYCMGSIHGAVCQPSRAMLLTGRTLYRVPMNLEATPTLPELLAQRGYQTFITGKWHNGAASVRRSFESGRSVFLGGMSNHEAVPLRDLADGALSDQGTGDGFSSALFADAAIAFLEDDWDRQRPFFAYVSFTAPHDPRQPPSRWRQRYARERPPLPVNFMPRHPFHNGWMTGRDERLAPWPRPPSMIRDQLGEYYGMISHLDEQIGRILDALERGGIAERTLVVYAADHGLALGSHGLLGKQSLYEHSMKAPLIVAGPGVPRGTSDALVYLHDLFPTLAAAAETALPADVEGLDLTPIWTGAVPAVRAELFTTYEDLMRAVRDERWKLIRYPQIDHTQLFDLQCDPHELQNLAGTALHASREAAMMAALRRWQDRCGDTQPLTVVEPRPMTYDLSGHPREPDRWQPAWIVEKYFGPPASGEPEG